MVHDKLSGGEINRQLAKEAAKVLKLKQTVVLASASDGVRRICDGLGLSAGDQIVVSPLAPAYWIEVLSRNGLVPLFADVLESSPVLDPASVAALLPAGPKAVVADCCLGYLPDVPALTALGLPVIEDMTHGAGGRLAGQAVGTQGAAVLMHFSPETLMAGAGGCLVGFRNPTLEEDDLATEWDTLSDLGSALILSQWQDAESFAEKKREHFRHLFHRLPRAYRQPKQAGDGEPVLPWFPILVESGAKEVLSHARKKAVEADWAFRHRPHLNVDSAADFCPRARYFLFHTLVFPLYSTFSLKELELLGKVISSLP